MDSNFAFVIKVFGASALISIAIKSLAPSLTIPANLTTVLLLVLLPSLGLAVFLGWRSRSSKMEG